MKPTIIKNTLHIIVLVILGWLCYQMHEITEGVQRLADQQYRYEQITQYGTLCNIEHFTKDIE